METSEVNDGVDNMRNKGTKVSCEVVKLSTLPDEVQKLCMESLDARTRAYAPYSNFLVGCALRTEAGIIKGCNVENAALPMCVCAEVTAVTKAVSEGYREFSAVAIATNTQDEFCAPCGACRQTICEFNPDVVIYLVRASDEMVQITNLDSLLPQCFTPKRRKMEFSK